MPGEKDTRQAKDLLKRDFSAPRPNHAWVTDFTYVLRQGSAIYRCRAGNKTLTTLADLPLSSGAVYAMNGRGELFGVRDVAEDGLVLAEPFDDGLDVGERLGVLAHFGRIALHLGAEELEQFVIPALDRL